MWTSLAPTGEREKLLEGFNLLPKTDRHGLESGIVLDVVESEDDALVQAPGVRHLLQPNLCANTCLPTYSYLPTYTHVLRYVTLRYATLCYATRAQ